MWAEIAQPTYIYAIISDSINIGRQQEKPQESFCCHIATNNLTIFGRHRQQQQQAYQASPPVVVRLGPSYVALFDLFHTAIYSKLIHAIL